MLLIIASHRNVAMQNSTHLCCFFGLWSYFIRLNKKRGRTPKKLVPKRQWKVYIRDKPFVAFSFEGKSVSRITLMYLIFYWANNISVLWHCLETRAIFCSLMLHIIASHSTRLPDKKRLCDDELDAPLWFFWSSIIFYSTKYDVLVFAHILFD